MICRFILLSAACAVAPLASHAAVMTFESLAMNNANVNDAGSSYTENGFVITQGIGENAPLATFGTEEFRFPGSTALFNNADGGLVTLSLAGGGEFDLFEIDVSELLGDFVASMTFTGELALGGTVTGSLVLDGVFGFETYTFSPTFAKLKAVSWTQVNPFHQFDNIVTSDALPLSPVPVPGALGLLAMGLGGLGLVRRPCRR